MIHWQLVSEAEELGGSKDDIVFRDLIAQDRLF